ncbi:MAG: Ig-like domain-containing domain, partial [Bacteroidota bacterium]|nr:Ig-like domain-containing domain [Bacteroidota bacterium]
EPVKVEDVKKQIIITPPIEEEKYEIKVKNNVVTFQLKDKLQPNTTYTINMGEAVRDITESNRARNIILGFSTGNYIDSLSISGNVTHLMQGKAAFNAIVGIYKADDTLDIFTKRPLYLTKTDSAGNFQLSNLKNDKYRIYSFIDKNDNLKCDPLTESFGFKEDIIKLDSGISNVNIKLFRQDTRELKIQSSRPDGQYFLIKFNKYVKDYEIIPESNTVRVFHNIIEENKTIRIYNTFNQDSLKTSVVAYDTLDNKYINDVTMYFISSKKAKEPFNVSVAPSETEKISENFKME